MRNYPECVVRLTRIGIADDDAFALRRIAMTLNRWAVLECGDSDDYGSRGIERDEATGKPFWVYLPHTASKARRTPIADRETGALKRLGKIMARYPSFKAYHQGDPRGAALYILRPGDVPEGEKAESWYSRGVAVYQ